MKINKSMKKKCYFKKEQCEVKNKINIYTCKTSFGLGVDDANDEKEK